MSGLTGRHQPMRPQWLCRRCARPFPCPPERDRLVAVLGFTPELAKYACGLMEQAIPELAAEQRTPEQLWPRFLEWTGPVTSYSGFGQL